MSRIHDPSHTDEFAGRTFARAGCGSIAVARYETSALPFEAGAVGLDGVPALRLRSDRSQARGYGLLVAELESIPRSLRTLGRRLVEQFHDRPLALLGIRDGGREWRELLVVRPRLIEGGGGAVEVRKLTIDVEWPTAHDAEVVRGLAWDWRTSAARRSASTERSMWSASQGTSSRG